jgi:amino acid permease
MAFVGITFGLVISVYCGRILWRALMAFEKPIPTFMDLGYEVAGKFGQIVTGISVCFARRLMKSRKS